MSLVLLRSLAVSCVAGGVLAGCATPPAAPTHAGELTAVGRVAIRLPSDNQIANFTWRDDGQQAQLALASPLGSTVAELTFNADGARLRDQQGNVTEAPTPDSLLKTRTGWDLPVSGLRYWIQAKADPASAADVRDTPEGRHIEQAGWVIDATDMIPAGERGQLPKRVKATREGVGVSIVISDWQWQ